MNKRPNKGSSGRMRNGPASAWLFGCALGALLFSAAGLARDAVGDPAVFIPDTVEIALNKSRILYLPGKVKKASVGNPEIADLLVVAPTEIYLLGKKMGSTNVTLWDSRGKLMKSFDVEVGHDLAGLKKKLYELMPRETFKVFSSQNDLVITGEISSTPKLDAAVAIAQGYLPGDTGKVLPLAQVGGSQQVMLEVKVAEVARTVSRDLDINFDAFSPGSPWQIGAVNGGPFAAPDTLIPISDWSPGNLIIDDVGLFANYLTGNFAFNLTIEAAKNHGLAKILAEPTLMAISGQEATFLAGGEIPIPVAQEEGAISIEYKDYGVGVSFLPVVLDSGLISLKVNVSVSELSGAAGAVLNLPQTESTFAIPSLTKRSAATSVEVQSGQTIGLAGLLRETLLENVNKFPGLGDVPVMGALFRSQAFAKGETELVIFVTPRLAKPMDSEIVRLPTDVLVEPNDAEFYLMGKLEGASQFEEPGVQQGGGTEGGFGHAL